MNPLDRLSDYLRTVERKLRLLAWTRGAALTAAAALILTVVLVLIANRYAFSDNSLTASRTVLFVSLALAIGFGLLLPLLRLNSRRAAKEAEQKFPEFEARLLTFAERRQPGTRDPFLELLAADAMRTAEQTQPSRVANPRSLIGLGSAGLLSVMTLVWLATSGPGFWGYGTSLLWAGPPRSEATPFYSITVEPGNRTVRKRSDQLITAQPLGFTPSGLRFFAKYASASKWEEAAMRARAGQPGFEFLIAGVPETLEYYVESGNVRSKTFKLNVVELPNVKKIKVTYTYPSWSGMTPSTEDPGGDLRAIEGSTAQLEIQTDRPIGTGFLALDNGTKIPLSDGKAVVPIQKDGMYYVAVTDRGEDIRLTDDYFIEAKKDNAPLVKIVRPGRDAKANPVEEVPVTVEANDDFGVHDLSLVYSVNGGAPKTVSLLERKGVKDAQGKYLMTLEDFKMAPGDVVSMYATTKDARNSAQTDIYFVEAQPFEREFTQAQTGGGGGGGGGGEPEKISQRQKEIIAATWNEIRGKSPDSNVAKFLSDMQSKLRDQTRSLAERTRSRALAGANQEFKTFVAELDKAAESMTPASDKLKQSQWKDALSPEQKALQHLLRAESVFRQIQVAYGNRGGGGGGGNMGRDLENLFDLELDTEKNQYETGQQQSAGQRQKEIDEALQKLEQLARRQQELAEQRQKNQPQTAQQRWQQEMLRREAEQLQRQMEQMTRNGQQQQQQSSSSSSSSSSSQQGQSGQQGQQSQQSQQSQMSRQQQQQQQQQMQREHSPMNSQNQAQLERALERLKQATRDMQNAASSQMNGTPQSEAEARRAAERLQEARDMIAGMRRQEAGSQVGDLANRAEQLAGQQRDFQQRLGREMGVSPDGQQRQQPGGMSRERLEQLASEKDRMSNELQQLERQIQNAARETSTTDRGTSTKLRQALGELQQDEISRKMKWSADTIRRGGGSYAYMREMTTTYALDNLRDKLKDAASGMDRGKGGQEGLEQALRQTEAVRQQMEQLARSLDNRNRGQQQGGRQQGNQQGQQQGNQQGQQPGRGQQSGQQGQQPGQQPGGNQPGQQGQQGQSGQQGQGQQSGGNASGRSQDGRDQLAAGARPDGSGGDGGGFRAMNTGERMPLDGGAQFDPSQAERAIREGVRDLMRLRESLGGEAPELTKDVQDLIREMSRLDPKRFPGNPELVERLRSQIVGGMEHLELQLRRKLDDKGGSVRAGASEPVPQGYSKSVAEYFRKLSKQ